MRCISPYPRYSIQVFEGKERVAIDDKSGVAYSYTIEKPVVANFQQGGLLDHEIEFALTKFNFSGLAEGVNPLTRIATFDTETYAMQNGLDEDGVAAIDQRLRHLAEQNPSEFIVIDQPAAEKPWPTYDEQSAEDVIFTRNLTDASPEKVRLYELEHEARQEVIDAMEALELEKAGVSEVIAGVSA